MAVLAGATSYRSMLVFITVHREHLSVTFSTALACTQSLFDKPIMLREAVRGACWS